MQAQSGVTLLTLGGAIIDTSKAEAFVNEIVEQLRWDLGLARWTLDFMYGHINPTQSDNTTLAVIRTNPDYWRATIEINPEAITDEVELFRVLRHELLHLILKPHSNYTRMLSRIIPDEADDLVAELHIQANEELVSNLEWMLSHMQLHPERHLQLIRERMKADELNDESQAEKETQDSEEAAA